MSPHKSLGEHGGTAGGTARVIPIRTLTSNEGEVERVLQICNACRYCEGYCAVFPAMTRRLVFNQSDIHYLANLCHNCGACLHACQYAAPHEFAVNVPQAMARVRLDTYSVFAWPPSLAVLYRRNGVTLSLALVAALALFLTLAAAQRHPLWEPVTGGFYGIFPHQWLVSLFAPVFLYAMFSLGIGVHRFWRQQDPGTASGAAVAETTGNLLRLKYLDGGHGDGCNNSDDRFTHWRRRFHHLTFYGFMLCFAATAVATLCHYLLNLPAPYGYASLPKLLGISGGVSLMIGTAGLFWLNLQRHPEQGDVSQRPMDRAFMSLLFATAASGLTLVSLKQSSALTMALCLHLGCVMALFVTMPYGKFAHGIYRSAALLKWAIERRRPEKLQLGDD